MSPYLVGLGERREMNGKVISEGSVASVQPCSAFMGLLASLVEDNLSEGDRTFVRRHLSVCGRCSAEFAAELHKAMQEHRLPDVPVPPLPVPEPIRGVFAPTHDRRRMLSQKIEVPTSGLRRRQPHVVVSQRDLDRNDE